MKRLKHLQLALIAALIFASATTTGQERYYLLTEVKEVKTAKTKDQKRVGSCWSNAGTAFLEAEWIRTGKQPVDISTMDFTHNVYLKKADMFLNSDGELRVDPMGMAYDVIMLVEEYGMVPESAYMYPTEDMTTREKQGEMDAILRGTLNMIQQRGEGFTERWQNVYNTSLLRYMGESMIEFSFNEATYTPETFATASGLSMDDYILLTSDKQADMYARVKPGLRENWAGHEFYNVPFGNFTDAIKNNIEQGYTVVWYGVIDGSQVFNDEKMAIVPVGDLPGDEVSDEDEDAPEPEYKPLTEKSISSELRTEVYEAGLEKEQDYLLIYGIKTDQEGNTYFAAKYVCKTGDKKLNLSKSFVDLNTVFLMMNKNGLSADMKSKLGI